jgi:hypothetical protein
MRCLNYPGEHDSTPMPGPVLALLVSALDTTPGRGVGVRRVEWLGLVKHG